MIFNDSEYERSRDRYLLVVSLITSVERSRECLRLEYKAGKAGKTSVTAGWLSWARAEIRRMGRQIRTLENQRKL